MEEIWKTIEDYPDYEVSNYGRIRSLDYRRTGETRILKTKIDNDGYEEVWLCNEDGKKEFRVHRLVANAFLPNPNNYPQLNHKNEIRDDNRVENLEWCTPQYNIDYSLAIPVLQFDMNGNFIQEFKSTNEASRRTGIDQSSISKCCNGKEYYHSAGGYIWKFKD